MRGRDGRPHSQRTGESFYKNKTPASKALSRNAKFPEIEVLYREQTRKQELQGEKARTKLFNGCVFYILGFAEGDKIQGLIW
jgi:hypothetical protein